MSFGLRDKDWVDPPEQPALPCMMCVHYTPCPCDCGHGWCDSYEDFVFGEELDACGHGCYSL